MTDVPCHGHGDLFFAERPEVLARAQELCVACPVRDLCLAGALERHEEWGVWGGQILVHGKVVASKRGRGRPRKATRTTTGTTTAA
jgi:WhiB family redox-sensing transcriptional regulator